MKELAKLLKREKFDWYVAISRGGLVPACLLAQQTGCKAIDTICISRYEGDNRHGNSLMVASKSFSHIEGKRVLLIDDLVDEGTTMANACRMLGVHNPSVLKTLVVYRKRHSKFEPDFCLEEVNSEKWITFPWEVAGNVSALAIQKEAGNGD